MPPSDWQRSKSSADRFEPEAKRILAEHFIRPATREEDIFEATDLRVFSVAPLTVAWRHRDAKYLTRYPHDITIRLARPSGARTEFDKIVDGWGHVFLYTFGDESSLKVVAWRLIDLDALRAQMIKGPALRYVDCPNPDGSSVLRAYNTRSFAPGVQLAKHRERASVSAA
jgi:hypothetical protein